MDKAYFEQYCGEGSYDTSYRDYSRVEHCISIAERLDVPARSVVVLGTATGRVLEDFEQAWGVRPWGCEISRWAHARIPARYRRRIERADMRAYVRGLARRGRHFDLCFCNSLVYLPADHVPGFLALCREVVDHFHFWSSTSEDHEPNDSYRVTLRPKHWWRKRFLDAGFEPTRSPYLWRACSA